MISWKPFKDVNGTTYELSHLHPYITTFEQPAKGQEPAKLYDVQVIFSLHCFTRGLAVGDDVNGVWAYSDSRETRIFDQSRYECSKRLQAIIKELPKSPCFHTGHGNFFTVRLLNEVSGIDECYEVYFKASRSGTKPARVNLFVESAYVRDRAHANRPAKKKISFFVILHNTLRGKEIKEPPQ